MSTIFIRGSVIQVYLEVDGERYDVANVASSEIGPLLGDGSLSQVVPTFVCALTSGVAISTLEQKFQVTRSQFKSFLKYPSARVMVTVTSVAGTGATHFLKDGTYVLIDGDIVEASYSKKFLSVAGASVYYEVRIAHKLRRLMFGDLSAHPVYGWDIFLPRDYGVKGVDSFSAVYSTIVDRLRSSPATRIYEDFIYPLILLRLNPSKAVAALAAYSTDVSSSNSARGTSFPEAVDTVLRALAGSNVGDVAAVSKENLQTYASAALELLVSKVQIDNSKVSNDNKRKLQEFMTTVMQSHLLTSDVESLGLIGGLMVHANTWIVPTSVGGFIMPVPCITPVATRKLIPLEDYSSATIEVKDKGVDEFVGGFIGFRPQFQTGEMNEPVEEASFVSIVNSPLGRGGLVRKINLPDWFSSKAANSEIIEETFTEKDKADKLKQAGTSTATSFTASNPDIDILAINFLSYRAIGLQLSNLIIKVVGPFRLDLAPGQPVEIEMPSGDFSEETHWYCGYVVSIAFVLDAESGSVSTQYTLCGLAEKSIYDQYLDAGKHPFVVENEQSYSTAWSTTQTAT